MSIERKALSRTLHLLADADIGIHSSRNSSWYEAYDYCAYTIFITKASCGQLQDAFCWLFRDNNPPVLPGE